MMKTGIAVILSLLLAVPALVNTGCASRPKATAEQQLYYNHGGDTLRRKRTEVRTVEKQKKVWNADTNSYDTVTETGTETVAVLEIETSDGRIVDYPASIQISNKLREGESIPTISEEEAASAGLIGECALVTKVVAGSNADRAGIQEDDLVIRYNGERALGYKRLSELINATDDADDVTIIVERDGGQVQLEAKGGYLGIEFEDYWR